jgi:hypothetical protein
MIAMHQAGSMPRHYSVTAAGNTEQHAALGLAAPPAYLPHPHRRLTRVRGLVRSHREAGYDETGAADDGSCPAGPGRVARFAGVIIAVSPGKSA